MQLSYDELVETIRTIHRHLNLADAVYDVRERKGDGSWKHIAVVEYGEAVKKLRAEGIIE